MNIYILFSLMIVSYLIGGIPSGYLYVRFAFKKNIRDFGSGNIGSTNVMRVFGKKAGITTFVFDFLKGFIVTLIARIYLEPNIAVFIGVMAIIGHIFPVYLKFKGGKGVATSAGVFFALCPAISFIAISIWYVISKTTKYVSLGSIVAVVSFPILMIISKYVIPETSIFYEYNFYILLVVIVSVLLVIFTHRTNISRLLKGKESKTGGK